MHELVGTRAHPWNEFVLMRAIDRRLRAELFLVSLTFIWGSTFVITKLILYNVSPFLYVLLRFSLACIIFGILFPRVVRELNKDAFLKGLMLGGFLFVGFALQTVGLKYTSASKSAFITGMLVVLTPVCQIAIERRSPKLGNILGVILVTVGLYFLTSPQGAEFNIGDFLTFGCAFCFALYIVYLDVFTKEYDTAQLTWVQFLTAAIGGGLAAVVAENAWILVNATLVWALVYMTLLATVVALYVQTKYQKETTPTRAAVIFSLEPVIAAVFAYLVLGEMMGWIGVIGGGLIVAGLLVSELSDFIFPGGSSDQRESITA